MDFNLYTKCDGSSLDKIHLTANRMLRSFSSNASFIQISTHKIVVDTFTGELESYYYYIYFLVDA